MKMTLEEYMEAGDRSVEDPSLPLPLPCATCEEEVLEYENGVYRCPICGREVLEEDKEQYLHDILDGKFEI